ncbi:hypothetical protein [Pseudoteredinibacter isoporae]|uniref:Uncharacterized protein n=1 Tax=Pseudoteredinibacter isoporae TaxID=570281 RepID=A0A7X0JXC2_9GAMM|nr:hypothetical protein [Pseudoteredinibacter isoporae]MBB6523011.1 hypothetical protein [Pseudoteredinibacter isoporae]NHO88533.1 hypothetical protein [Pseudoteredinibacter isoporae]NIB22776.1 hypothetical protein [Pseudoteredinibacter isoporae]
MQGVGDGTIFTRLNSAYYALEKVERMGLWFAVLPMCLIVLFVSLYERPPYIWISVADMEKGDFKIHIRRESAYLIARLEPENRGFLRKSLSPFNTGKGVYSSDGLNPHYRVFSIESKFGLKLLAYKQHRFPSQSCEYLKYVSKHIIVDETLLNGGIICDDPTSETKRRTFIYDLGGRSVHENVADLFPPVFSLVGNELKIGI